MDMDIGTESCNSAKDSNGTQSGNDLIKEIFGRMGEEVEELGKLVFEIFPCHTLSEWTMSIHCMNGKAQLPSAHQKVAKGE